MPLGTCKTAIAHKLQQKQPQWQKHPARKWEKSIPKIMPAFKSVSTKCSIAPRRITFDRGFGFVDKLGKINFLQCYLIIQAQMGRGRALHQTSSSQWGMCARTDVQINKISWWYHHGENNHVLMEEGGKKRAQICIKGLWQAMFAISQITPPIPKVLHSSG